MQRARYDFTNNPDVDQYHSLTLKVTRLSTWWGSGGDAHWTLSLVEWNLIISNFNVYFFQWYIQVLKRSSLKTFVTKSIPQNIPAIIRARSVQRIPFSGSKTLSYSSGRKYMLISIVSVCFYLEYLFPAPNMTISRLTICLSALTELFTSGVGKFFM